MNPEQEKAAFAPSSKDLLVSAGAGSGKTKTLSERVFHLISTGEIRPDQLLVLTFTDNSSYDMKRKILNRFGPSDPMYQAMLSSHVQSFDSFNAYLARVYAGALGIAPAITILPTAIQKQKVEEAIDQAFDEAYNDPIRRKVLVDFAVKLGSNDDSEIRESVELALKELSKIVPDKRLDYIKNYKAKFLSPSFTETLYEKTVDSFKEKIRVILRKAHVIDETSGILVRKKGNEATPEEIEEKLSQSSLYSVDLSNIHISRDKTRKPENDYLDAYYQALLALLDVPALDFPLAAATFLKDHEDWFGTYKTTKKPDLDESNYLKPVAGALNECKAVLNEAKVLEGPSGERDKLAYYEDGVLAIFELVEAAEKKMEAYRTERNAFTFADVTALALSLFLDPKHEAIANELRERFRYVMVDEYQDTNDFQEIFLDGLLKPRASDGGRAHLFCVGDAKQSIYAFRNSNVALFRKRLSDYKAKPDSEAEVIAMNKNYRSAKRLLDDINYIFSSYMRLDMGGIDYQDKMETLTYDPEVNLYYQDLPVYGVHRIIPEQTFYLDNKRASEEKFIDDEFEAKAILTDIKEKLSSGYRVFDRDIKGSAKEGTDKTRPCRPSDFCILVRKKAPIGLYQKLFNENGVPLNNHLSVNLREVTAVITLQSLVGLLSYAMGHPTDLSPVHLFASVARSYLFSYSDQALHEVLDATDPLAAMEQEPMMVQLRDFASRYAEAPLQTAFIALVEEFGVIANLYLLGEVEDNVAKIESLYALLATGVSLGDGIKEFVALFADIDKRRLKIESESIFASSDAVDLMTIHASKGLERKIVYLPSSENGISRGGGGKKPLATFTKDKGLLFPYLVLPEWIGTSVNIAKDTRTLAQRVNAANEVDEEEQEHVRLLYVALTRAENAVYLVGRNLGDKSAYVMMKDLPSHLELHPQLAAMLSPAELATWEKLGTGLPKDDIHDDPAFIALWEKYGQKQYKESISAGYLRILLKLYRILLKRFLDGKPSVDDFARLYGLIHFPKGNIRSLDELKKYQGSALDLSLFDDEDEEEEEEPTEEALLDEAKLELTIEEQIERFALGLADNDFAAILPNVTLAKTKLKDASYPTRVLIDNVLAPLAKVVLGIDCVCYVSYKSPKYNDDTSFFSLSSFAASNAGTPTLASLHVGQEDIAFVTRISRRASKAPAGDEELPDKAKLERGEKLHRYMELLDFTTKDLSYIQGDDVGKAMIERALEHPLMKDAFAADQDYVFPEYRYYDVDHYVNGIIDLLYVKDGIYHIVDYKTSHIDDPDYDFQLRRYGENVCRLFGVTKDKVKLHLLSLAKGTSRDVDFN